MDVTWPRIFNRLFEIINGDNEAYFSGSRFISAVKEIDPYFPDYYQYIEERRHHGLSTSRKDFFYDILMNFEEPERVQIILVIASLTEPVCPILVRGLLEDLNQLVDDLQLPIKDTPPSSEAKEIKNEESITSNKVFETTPPLPRSPHKPQNTLKRVISRLGRFWLDHWKWIIGTSIAISAVIVAYITGR